MFAIAVPVRYDRTTQTEKFVKNIYRMLNSHDEVHVCGSGSSIIKHACLYFVQIGLKIYDISS